jgi:hypothetical protein
MSNDAPLRVCLLEKRMAGRNGLVQCFYGSVFGDKPDGAGLIHGFDHLGGSIHGKANDDRRWMHRLD